MPWRSAPAWAATPPPWMRACTSMRARLPLASSGWRAWTWRRGLGGRSVGRLGVRLFRRRRLFRSGGLFGNRRLVGNGRLFGGRRPFRSRRLAVSRRLFGSRRLFASGLLFRSGRLVGSGRRLAALVRRALGRSLVLRGLVRTLDHHAC